MLQMSIQYLPRGMNGSRSLIIGSAGSVGRNNLIATIQPSAGPTVLNTQFVNETVSVTRVTETVSFTKI